MLDFEGNNSVIANNTFNTTHDGTATVFGIEIGGNNNLLIKNIVQNDGGILIGENAGNNSLIDNTMFYDDGIGVQIMGTGNLFTNNTMKVSDTGTTDLNVTGTSNAIWINHFLSKGASVGGFSNIFCVNREGNLYNESIAPENLISTGDCGLTNITNSIDGAELSGVVKINWTNQSSFTNVTYELYLGNGSLLTTTTESSFIWDTVPLPEGAYTLRIVPYITQWGTRINATANESESFTIVKQPCDCLLDNNGQEEGVCIVENAVCTANANLTTVSGGNITLVNTTVRMNSTMDGELGIEVRNGGTIAIRSGSHITNGDADASFAFQVLPSAVFSFSNSSLSNAGWADQAGRRGLELYSTPQQLFHNTFSDNFVSITAYANNVDIAKNSFIGEQQAAMYLGGVGGVHIHDNSVNLSLGEGIRFIGAVGNSSIENNFFNTTGSAIIDDSSIDDNLSIINNTFNVTFGGTVNVDLHNANHVKFFQNRLLVGTASGISVEGDTVQIVNNSIYLNSNSTSGGAGVRAKGDVVLISDNVIYHNYGVILENVHFGTVQYNQIFYHQFDGIQLSEGSNNQIQHNAIQVLGQGTHDLISTDSLNNTVWLNHFYSKGVEGSNTYCFGEGNLYNASIPAARIGAGDCGLSNLSDSIDGAVLHGIETITWEPQHSQNFIHYQLYLINQSGGKMLLQDTNATNYTWDTTHAADGPYRLQLIPLLFTDYVEATHNLSENFTIDNTPPSVLNISPVPNTSISPGTVVNISANITDNLAVDAVMVNLTYPNGTKIRFSMENSSTKNFSAVFNATAQIGVYTITIEANDSAGNLNNTQKTAFIVIDLPPTLLDAKEFPGDPTTYASSKFYQFNITCIDDSACSIVKLNFNGTVRNSTQFGEEWQANVTNLAAGIYNYNWSGNDTNGNGNTSEQFTYTVTKNTSAEVNLLLNGTDENISVEIGAMVNLTAHRSIGDNGVGGNITKNGTLLLLGTLPLMVIELFNSTGTFIINATQAESQNYTLASEIHAVTVQDMAFPIIENLTEIPSDPATYASGKKYNFTADITDKTGISRVWIQWEGTNNTAMYLVNNTYKFNKTDLAAGVHTYTWFANDTSNNVASSGPHTYTVNKSTTALNLIIMPSNQTTYPQQTTASCTANNGEVTITLYRNGTSVTNPEVQLFAAGTYNYTCIAVASQNYTSAQSQNILSMVKNSSAEVMLQLNNSRTNVTIAVGAQILLNASKVRGDTVVMGKLYYNGMLQNFGNLPLTNLSNFSILGTFNITAEQNESENYTKDAETWFVTTVDQVSPMVTNADSFCGESSMHCPYSIGDKVYEKNSQVNISASVSDNYLIGVVVINLTYPNASTVKNNTLNKSTIYWAVINITNQLGLYTARFITNDSVGNSNNSITTSFRIDDATPTVLSLTPPRSYAQAVVVNLSANVTDNFVIGVWNRSSVLIGCAVTGGAGTFRVNCTNSTLFNSDMKFSNVNSTFLNSSTVRNLLSINSTIEFTNVQHINASHTFISGNQTASRGLLNDLNGLHHVQFNLTYPNGTSKLFNARFDIQNNYSIAFNDTSQLGLYNFAIFANDSSGNLNSTEHANFTVHDSTFPNVSYLNSTGGTLIAGTATNISANVTDEQSLSTIFASIIFPNSTIYNITMLNSTFRKNTTQSPNNFSIRFNDTSQVGTYIIRIGANDTGNNMNDTTMAAFTVVENLPPSAKFIFPLPGSTFNQNNSINLSANVTDDIAVDKVFANITFPNASTALMRLFNVSANNFTGLLNNTAQIWLYNITFIANDTANAINSTTRTNFTIVREINIFNVSQLLINNSDRVFEFAIKNTNNKSDNLSWMFKTGEGQILGIQSVNLTANETLFAYIRYPYGANGTFTAIATANNSKVYDSENITVMV